MLSKEFKVRRGKPMFDFLDYVLFNLGNEGRPFRRRHGNFVDGAGGSNKMDNRVAGWVFSEEAIESTPPIIPLTKSFRTNLTFGAPIVTSTFIEAATLLLLASFVLICVCPSLPWLVTHRVFWL